MASLKKSKLKHWVDDLERDIKKAGHGIKKAAEDVGGDAKVAGEDVGKAAKKAAEAVAGNPVQDPKPLK